MTHITKRIEESCAKAGIPGAKVLRVEYDHAGYPLFLLEALAIDEITPVRGWWYNGESIDDIRWQIGGKDGWSEEVL